jgi:hypothetical protein
MTEETSLVAIDSQVTALGMAGPPPEEIIEDARRKAVALKTVLDQKRAVMINGKRHLEFGDWQLVARFYGLVAAVDWTREIAGGWEARASAINVETGMAVSHAESQCTDDEPRWGNRPSFQRRSMAQTRASAKVLRNALGWVAEIGGYASTPAEEMDGDVVSQNGTPPTTARATAGAKGQRCAVHKTPFALGPDKIWRCPAEIKSGKPCTESETVVPESQGDSDNLMAALDLLKNIIGGHVNQDDRQPLLFSAVDAAIKHGFTDNKRFLELYNQALATGLEPDNRMALKAVEAIIEEGGQPLGE